MVKLNVAFDESYDGPFVLRFESQEAADSFIKCNPSVIIYP